MVDYTKPGTEFCALIGLSVMILEPSVYAKFLRGETTDEEVFEILTSNLPFENQDLRYIKAEIEGAVIALSQRRTPTMRADSSSLSSPLIDKHRRTEASINWGQGGPSKDEQESLNVIEWFGRYWQFLHNNRDGSTLIEAMRSLELLLPDQ